MKTLNAYVIYNADTTIDLFQKVNKEFEHISSQHGTDIEKAIDAINSRSVDMLIMDKKLDKPTQVKLNKLIDLIDPDVATVELHMNDEDFIRFKLGDMNRKWQEANSHSIVNFIDNPQL
ncbi:MAG: hypothetical protein JNM21_03095 [Taibaiella sp.]|nr:hypothetical protein [Taibaiella sp.]